MALIGTGDWGVDSQWWEVTRSLVSGNSSEADNGTFRIHLSNNSAFPRSQRFSFSSQRMGSTLPLSHLAPGHCSRPSPVQSPV